MKIHLIPGPGRKYQPEKKGSSLIKAANRERKQKMPRKGKGARNVL
jgi:hypothetical protein